MGTKRYSRVVYLLILLVSISFVLAAGGGGGGGGSSGGGSSSGGSSGSGSGPTLSNLNCDDRGVLSFLQNPAVKPVIVEKADGTTITLAGEWNGLTFTSDEAELQQAGTYIIRDAKNGDKTVVCPGLKFSCKLANLSLKSCTLSKGKVQAEFTLSNAAVEDLSYQFSLPGTARTLRYQQDSHSSELNALKVVRQGSDAYRVDVPREIEISKLLVSLPRCVGRYYAYSTIDCVKEPTAVVSEKNGKILKCGGYLDIADRVKCRFDLREEQADEYENFFPEECRSWEDQDACVQLYKSVQPCWKLPSQARISCLRAKVGVGSIANEQTGCAANAACRAGVRKKTFTLTKLRLYNLEEKAEELWEDGKITKDEVAAFVLRMEQSKLAFNQAQSKQERKAVIVQARQHWLKLLKTARG